MFDTPNSIPAPGWYTDPAGGVVQRYWDGAAWTDRTYDPISASSAPGVYPRIGQDVKLSTPWVWIIAVLPVISLIALLSIDYRQYLLDSIVQPTTPGSIPQLPAAFGTQLLVGAMGWGIYLVSALLAFFDWRALKSRGVQRPFHWAWSFLGAIVYLIGRPIVLRRRGRSAFASMWLYLAISVVSIVVSIAKVVDALPSVIDQLPTLG